MPKGRAQVFPNILCQLATDQPAYVKDGNSQPDKNVVTVCTHQGTKASSRKLRMVVQ